MDIYIVIKPWTATYQNPITIFGGQEVMIDKSKVDDDPDWPDWVWVVSADNSGWVPMQMLTVVEETDTHLWRASVNEDYTAKELTIEEGDRIEGEKVLNGWIWGRKIEDVNGEEGWVPEKCCSKL